MPSRSCTSWRSTAATRPCAAGRCGAGSRTRIDRKACSRITCIKRPATETGRGRRRAVSQGELCRRAGRQAAGRPTLWLAKMLVAAARKELNNAPIKLNLEYPVDSRGACDRAQARRRFSRRRVSRSCRPKCRLSQLEGELAPAGGSTWLFACSKCDEPVLDAGVLLCPGYDAPPEADALASAASPRILQLLLQLERAADWPTAQGLHADRSRVARRAADHSALAARRPLRLARSLDRPGQDRRRALSRDRNLGDRAVDRQGPWTESRSDRGLPGCAWRAGSPGMSSRGAHSGAASTGDSQGAGSAAASIGAVEALGRTNEAGRRRSQEAGRGCCASDRSRGGGLTETAGQGRRRGSRSSGGRIGSRSIWRAIRRPESTDGAAPALLRDWQVLVRRFVGPPWVVTIEPSQAAAGERRSAGDRARGVRGFTSFDKVWVVRISGVRVGVGTRVLGREYDTASRRLGPLQRRRSRRSAMHRARCWNSHSISSIPTAEITGAGRRRRAS